MYKPGEKISCLTAGAEKVVSKHLNRMFRELSKMKAVEFLYTDDDGKTVVAGLNCDTSFREAWCEEVANFMMILLRKYS